MGLALDQPPVVLSSATHVFADERRRCEQMRKRARALVGAGFAFLWLCFPFASARTCVLLRFFMYVCVSALVCDFGSLSGLALSLLSVLFLPFVLSHFACSLSLLYCLCRALPVGWPKGFPRRLPPCWGPHFIYSTCDASEATSIVMPPCSKIPYSHTSL